MAFRSCSRWRPAPIELHKLLTEVALLCPRSPLIMEFNCRLCSPTIAFRLVHQNVVIVSGDSSAGEADRSKLLVDLSDPGIAHERFVLVEIDHGPRVLVAHASCCIAA